ncbi:MAG: hypothetical protein ABR552_04600, partial [Actinomycetota bacterium]
VEWLGSPTPLASTSDTADWYLYGARITGAQTGTPTVAVARTTQTPLFHGAEEMPEFNQVRLDASGKIRIVASAYRSEGGGGTWTVYYQREQ